MDDKKLRLIAALVIVGIGIAYMTWLALEYVKSMRLDEYIRNHLDDAVATMRQAAPASKVVPGDVAKDDSP